MDTVEEEEIKLTEEEIEALKQKEEEVSSLTTVVQK